MQILLELHYLPCLEYFAKLARFSQVLIEQCENYQKGSYRNRCHIAGANGLMRLSIPLQKGKNEQQNIRAVKIAYDENWQMQHWRSISSAYNNSPFFEHYAFFLEPFFQKKYTYLFDFNLALLEKLNQILGWNITINLTDNFQTILPKNTLDNRNHISPKIHKAVKDPQIETVKYAQVFEEKAGFIPNLSILDLIFCTGPQAGFILDQMTTENASQ